MLTRFLALFCLLLCAIAPLCAQVSDVEIKFKLAQSYERGGDYDSAVKLYEEIFAVDSTNAVFFESLRRLYLQLKRYDDARSLLERRLSSNPNDVGVLSQLGTVYLRAANEKAAIEMWDRAINVNPRSESNYRVVAGAMIESRMFERAIDVYKRGRKSTGDSLAFTADLASLYSAVLNYADATREFLRLVLDNPTQLGFIQSRIASFTGRPEGLDAATKVVEGALSSDANNVSLAQLLSWLYMEGKRFDDAYAVYKRLDTQTRAEGREMYNFAERALKEKAYRAASKAYQDVISTHPRFDRLQLARFGYARALEELSAEGDTLRLFGQQSPFEPDETPATESEPRFKGAIAAYRQIVQQYPGTEIAAKSLLRIAAVQFERFFNLDEGRSALESIEKEYAAFIPLVIEAKLRLGDLYFAMGDLRKSESAFQSIAGFRVVGREQQERAAMKLAELEYFDGRMKEALVKLAELTKNAASDVTNNALELSVFIQSNIETGETPLREFAKADRLKRQRKLAEALTAFRAIMEKFPEAELKGDILMNIGDVYAQMGKFAEAVAMYDSIISSMPDHLALDKALMKKGQIQQRGLNDAASAIAAYEELLTRFPNSIYATEARKHIRELRGDNL